MESGGSEMIMMMPDDIIVDILSRLEVKSVLICRCVCKSWKLITHQEFFIEKHEKRLKNKRPQILYQYDNIHRSNDEVYIYKDSCNGLVLEANRMRREYRSCSYRIRNPITKQVLQLKEDELVVPKRCNVFLGFDSSTGNFKMICLCRNVGRRGIGVIMVTIGSNGLSYESLDITLFNDGSRPRFTHNNDVCYALSLCYNLMEKSDLIRFTMDGKSSMNIKLPQGFLAELGAQRMSAYNLGRLFHMFIVDDDKLSIGFLYLYRQEIGFLYKQELHVWVLENNNKNMWSDKKIIHLEIPYGVVTFSVHNSPNLGKLHLTMDADYVEYDVHSKKLTYLAMGGGPQPVQYRLIPSLLSLKGMCSE